MTQAKPMTQISPLRHTGKEPTHTGSPSFPHSRGSVNLGLVGIQWGGAARSFDSESPSVTPAKHILSNAEGAGRWIPTEAAYQFWTVPDEGVSA